MDMEVSRQDFQGLSGEVKNMRVTLDAVHNAIVGSSISKDGGIVGRLIDAEEKLDTLEDRVISAEGKQIKYGLQTKVMWTCLGGVGMAIFAYLVQFIFKK